MSTEHSETIGLLERQASDAYTTSQYHEAELLYAEAARLSDSYADWATRIRNHFWKASSQRMQSKYEAALVTLGWIISLRYDPEVTTALADTDSIIYLYNAYLDMAGCGKNLSAMPIAKLHAILDEAEQFLEEVGHPEWAHGLHYQRGLLFWKEGKIAESHQKQEQALALRRREPESPVYALEAHILALADILSERKEYSRAHTYYMETLEGQGSSPRARCNATMGLADLARQQKNWAEAEHWAYEACRRAAENKSIVTQFNAHERLIRTLLDAKKVDEALQEASTLWRLGRQYASVEADYFIGAALCRVRIYCARQAVGLIPRKTEDDASHSSNTAASPPEPAQAPSENPFAFFQEIEKAFGDAVNSLFQLLGLSTPQAAPTSPPERFSAADRRKAERYLRAAERWHKYALGPAQKLDGQAQITLKTDYLQYLADNMRDLRSWMA